MSYPPPPGTGPNSLPARPPPPSGTSTGSSGTGAGAGGASRGFKPAFSPAITTASTHRSHHHQQQPQSYTRSAQPTYGPSYGPQSRGPSTGGYGPSSYPTYGGVSAQQQQQSAYSHHQQPTSYASHSYAPQQQPYAAAAGAPHIKNPFAQTSGVSSVSAAVTAAGGAGPDFDPEYAAQIAQWQSAYVSRDPQASYDKDGKPTAEHQQQQQQQGAGADAALPGVTDPSKKQTVVRQGGGKKWTDDTLLEWDPSHLRLFVGNLAGETTDESLLKAFSRWPTVQKARVVRDKRTSKSKGYGFVSFSDADDFFRAAKEMNGKYIQSHPVVVRKANTEIKVSNAKDKGPRGGRNGNKKNNHNNNKSGNGGGGGGGGNGGNGGYEPHLGPASGAGVTKPGQKTKNGLRLLG